MHKPALARAALRLDYARGEDRGAFYLSIGEAF